MGTGLLVALAVFAVSLAGLFGDARANTGFVTAQLQGVTSLSIGPMAVGGDSMNYLLSPPCGSALSEHRTSTGWKAISTPGPSCALLMSVVSDGAGGAWAAGYSVNSNGDARTLTEHFNGSAWTVVSTPSPGSDAILSSVTRTASGQLWAVGTYQLTSGGALKTLALENTGAGWVKVATPNPALDNQLNAVTVSSTGTVWAVGTKRPTSDFAQHTLTMKRTASGWTVVASPSPGGANNTVLEGIARGANGTLWAVGEYDFSSRTLAIHYDGTKWTLVPTPSPGTASDYLYGVRVAPNGAAWAVGGYTGSMCERTLTEENTGSGWVKVASPNRGTCTSSNSNVLFGVAADSHGVLYAVGQSDISTLIEQNNGSGWAIVASPN